MEIRVVTRKEYESLLKEGGDIYQKVANKYHISRNEAKSSLFPFIYGGSPEAFILAPFTPEELSPLIEEIVEEE